MGVASKFIIWVIFEIGELRKDLNHSRDKPLLFFGVRMRFLFLMLRRNEKPLHIIAI